MRADGRRADELRPLEIEVDYLEQPAGSALISAGKTRVLCTASITEGVPRWLMGKGKGWMTAEYGLLPASTGERTAREASSGRQKGRTVEIQRLIGRSLRAVTDLDALGERTLWIDCDVLQADGGTRCAAISGAYVASRRALDRFGLGKALTDSVAGVSLGIVDSEALLDLDYSEDSRAEVDLNVVMSGDGRLIEVQATRKASGTPASSWTSSSTWQPLASSRSARRSSGRWRPCLPDLSWAEVVLRILLAAGLGGAVGLERELREREAGLRTHMLVSVGAALFTMVSAYAWTDWRFSNEEGIVFDPTRIAAQVVTGIGFLGAGAIIRQGLSVRGLTTAATLWVVAAIGMAAGVGYYWAALVTTALVLLSLWPLRILAYRLSARMRPEEGRLALVLPAGTSAVSVLETVENAAPTSARSSSRRRATAAEWMCACDSEAAGPQRS